MQVLVLGAGILGISTAWYLRERGHQVCVVDRQARAAMETSFANGGQISVSFCEPWASASAPWKVARWLLQDDAPLLFRPRLDPQQWRWGLSFLTQCNDLAFERNVAQLVELGRYSQTAHHELVRQTGIEFHRLEKGILHFFASAQDFHAGQQAAEMMRRHGVLRQVLSRDEVIATEPALKNFAPHIAGGTYTASDESGDAMVFTQSLAQRCEAAGVEFLWEHDIEDLVLRQGKAEGAALRRRSDGQRLVRKADACVVALGSYSQPLLRRAGHCLEIYPAKGYSATMPLHRPERASTISLIDDARKVAITRLGDHVRVAGTAEMAGFDTSLDSPTARLRCQALVRRYQDIFPDTAQPDQAVFFAGLRPSTPSNLPYIGRSRVGNVWLNTGHGTLGWTHGAGSGLALADLMSGKRPPLSRFKFCGF